MTSSEMSQSRPHGQVVDVTEARHAACRPAPSSPPSAPRCRTPCPPPPRRGRQRQHRLGQHDPVERRRRRSGQAQHRERPLPLDQAAAHRDRQAAARDDAASARPRCPPAAARWWRRPAWPGPPRRTSAARCPIPTGGVGDQERANPLQRRLAVHLDQHRLQVQAREVGHGRPGCARLTMAWRGVGRVVAVQVARCGLDRAPAGRAFAERANRPHARAADDRADGARDGPAEPAAPPGPAAPPRSAAPLADLAVAAWWQRVDRHRVAPGSALSCGHQPGAVRWRQAFQRQLPRPRRGARLGARPGPEPVQLTLLPQTGLAMNPSRMTLLSAFALGVAVVALTAGSSAGDDRAEEDGEHQPADRPERGLRVVRQPPRREYRCRSAAEPGQQPGGTRGEPRARDDQADHDEQQAGKGRGADLLVDW